MSRTWAIMAPNNIIGNVIVADEDFIAEHPDLSQFERIDITDYNPQPAIMWELKDGKFIAPEHLRPLPEHRGLDDFIEIEVQG
jgi:hypothetical protein